MLARIETLQEASRILGIPAQTLNYYRMLGEITTKKSGRIYLVDVDQLRDEMSKVGYEPNRNHNRNSKVVK